MMHSTRPAAPTGLLVVLLAGLGFGLLTSAQETIVVTLDSPDPFTPAYGMVEIAAVVGAEEPVERVVFYVDGIVVGELTAPPYRLQVDVGQENLSHRFEVVAYGASGSTGRGTLSTPSFRIDEEVSVNLQQLYVTVTRGGQRVQDLQEEDFQAYDEGKAQQLVTFARGDIPFTGMVLLDSSVSMEGEKLQSALRGAKTFFNGMKSLDEGRLLVFSDRILHLTPFTTSPEILTVGLSRVEAKGGTALNDHLYMALKDLETRQGRRVVVVLSDGVDSHSVLAMEDVLAKARRSQALIYWLQLPYSSAQTAHDIPRLSTNWRNSDRIQEEFALLRQTVEESGGRIQLLGSIHEIEAAFQGILEELRDQYVLGYYPSGGDQPGRWRRVEVRLPDHSDLQVRHRDGYINL
jgi:Ca-activated chloride channel family protein